MKKTILSAILCVSAIVISSCSKDFLDTKSTQSVDESTIFESTETAKMAIEGMNRHMYYYDGTAPRMGYNTFILWNEVLGDDMMYSKKNAQWTTQSKWELHRNTTSSINRFCYRWCYEMIMSANTVIRNMDGSTIKGTPAEKAFMKAQALTYRAFAEFAAVQWWAERYDSTKKDNEQDGIVLRPNNDTDPIKARSTVEETYAAINADLDEAIRLFDEDAILIDRSDKSNINSIVAKGIKARVLLVQGKWEEAAKMADVAIAEAKLAGAAFQNDTWAKKVGRGCDHNNTEWIWCQIAEISMGIHYFGQFHSYISNTNVSYNKNTPRCINNLLYARIPEGDSRKGLWLVDPTSLPKTEIVYPPAGNLYPWMSQKNIVCAIDNTSPEYDGSLYAADVPYMRLPELYLIAAEGYARAGKTTEARARVTDMATTRYAGFNCSSLSGEALIDEIMFQRRIELWGEGFRFTDLKRLNLPLDRGPKPREGYNPGGWKSGVMPTNLDPLASNFNMYDAQEIGEENRYKKPGIKEWQFLIPQDEIDSNPACHQNTL